MVWQVCHFLQRRRNTLGIDAVGAPQPTFAGFRTQITSHTIGTAFRAGWQGDFPSMLEFLEPLFVTRAGANDVGYSNPRLDAAMAAAEAAPDLPQSFTIANDAQRILLQDMPVVPLWYTVAVAGRSAAVSHLVLSWNGLPDYERIVKT
jgi:oligopeptide transport system substrate-binding protein